MKYVLVPGTTYNFILFAIVDGKEYKDNIRSFTTLKLYDSKDVVISTSNPSKQEHPAGAAKTVYQSALKKKISNHK